MAEKIKVFIRIRPARQDLYSLEMNDTISDDSIGDAFEYHYKQNEFVMNKKIYTIDGILPPDTKQSDAFQRIASHQIDQFLKGFNATIFAYGQTGAGKTHTIFGPDLTQEFHDDINPNPKVSIFGIVPRAFINVHERLSTSKNIKKYQMILSCVEVYNTRLRDLIQPGNSDNLRIREDRVSKGFFVQKLTEETVDSSEELILFIKRIQLNRSVSATNMNVTSSRSHVLLRLKLIQQLLDGETKESLLTFVDLAGSEMCKKSGAHGDTLKEAGYINSSLSCLSRVIEALGKSQGKKNKNGQHIHIHIPFRDSSLTKLLKSALGGNCKTALVVCVSQEPQYKEETLSTLRFASRAASIECKAVVNIVLDAKKLYQENLILKGQIEKLKADIGNTEHHNLLQLKLNELEQKETEIAELQKYLEELQLKLEQHIGDNDKNLEDRLKEIEKQNIALTQTVSDLEIQLTREKKSKQMIQEKLNDLQVNASEAAAQKVVDQTTDIMNAIKLRRKMKQVVMNQMPELKVNDTDPETFDSMFILDVCKVMDEKIQNAEQKTHGFKAEMVEINGSLNNQLEKDNEAVKQMNGKLHEQENQINDLQSRIVTLQREHNERVSNLHSKINELEHENANQGLDLNKLQPEIGCGPINEMQHKLVLKEEATEMIQSGTKDIKLNDSKQDAVKQLSTSVFNHGDIMDNDIAKDESIEIIMDENKTKIESSTKTENGRQTMDETENKNENKREPMSVKTPWSILNNLFKCNSGLSN